MRMWNVDPTIMCRKHLLGEHVEMHMMKGSLQKGISVEGFLNRGLMDIGSVKKRHDILARELIGRGYKHQSPMPPFHEGDAVLTVDANKSKMELHSRCAECRRLADEH